MSDHKYSTEAWRAARNAALAKQGPPTGRTESRNGSDGDVTVHNISAGSQVKWTRDPKTGSPHAELEEK